MTTLTNVTDGASLITSNIIPGVITIFATPPLVYFVAIGLVALAWKIIYYELSPMSWHRTDEDGFFEGSRRFKKAMKESEELNKDTGW